MDSISSNTPIKVLTEQFERELRENETPQNDLFNLSIIDDDRRNNVEQLIEEKKKNSDFDIREFTVEIIVDKYTTKSPRLDNNAELYMPDYQREYKWSLKQQSEFIESIMIDLPVPYIYVSDVKGGNNDARMEIIDGSQRIRTLARFVHNMFSLQGLSLLPEMNGFKFKDFSGARQVRFLRKTIRFIELLKVDEEARRQIFYRLNSGGTKLKDMEIRYGTNDGKFLNFIKDLSQNEQFRRLCPIGNTRLANKDYSEMLLRFFAYRFDMQSYKKQVNSFLTDFMYKMNGSFEYSEGEERVSFDEQKYRTTFFEMLDFVAEHYAPLYFRKTINNNSVPRIRFEALSVGTSLALAQNESIKIADIDSWLVSEEFALLTDSDASNSIPKLIDRTFYVRNHLLGIPWRPTSTSFIKILEGRSIFPFMEQDSDEDEAGEDASQYVLF